MKLSLAWWNTALSPSGKSRANVDQKTIALNLLNKLLIEFEIDFIALGEVSDEDIRFLRHRLTSGYSINDNNLDTGEIKFHTCFVCREQKITVTDSINRVLKTGNQNFRIAQRVDLLIAETNDLMRIFISHWQSRLYCQQNDPIRHHLGLRLHDAVDEAFEKSQYIILMGDYNDEPFDFSLSEQLKAPRDINFARNRKHLLYNPFWRHMVLPLSKENETEKGIAGGSYYHKQGTVTRWRTFDQIIFSVAFLGNSDWHLNEHLTGIVDIPEYSSLVLNNKVIVDHLPVVGVIERDLSDD